MIVLSDMVKDILFSDGYSDREKVLLVKKLMEPELKVDVYTERLANLCDADRERAKERAERRREQNRQAQQRYRESHVGEPSGPVGEAGVRKQSKQASAGVSKSKQCKHLTDTDTEPIISESESIPRTDSDACVRVRGGESGYEGPPAAASDACGGRMPSPWTMSDEELMSGAWPTVTILKAALGKGCWRLAVQQLGEADVLGEFAAFRAELRAGESVNNRAAAFTARLVKMGYNVGRRE